MLKQKKHTNVNMHSLTPLPSFTLNTHIQRKVRWVQINNNCCSGYSSSAWCEDMWFMIKRGFIVTADSELDFHHGNCKLKRKDVLNMMTLQKGEESHMPT